MKWWRNRKRKQKNQKRVKAFEKRIDGKTFCEVFGHDFVEEVTYGWDSNVKEIRKVCKRCGKEEKEVEPV